MAIEQLKELWFWLVPHPGPDDPRILHRHLRRRQLPAQEDAARHHRCDGRVRGHLLGLHPATDPRPLCGGPGAWPPGRGGLEPELDLGLRRCVGAQDRRDGRPSDRRDVGHGLAGRALYRGLLRRLYGRRSPLRQVPQLRLALRRRDAGPGGLEQLPHAAGLLGDHGALQLPADRLLVSQRFGAEGGQEGLHGHPARRLWDDHRHRARLRAQRVVRVRPDLQMGGGGAGTAGQHRGARVVHWARSASRHSFRCMSGCPTRWKADAVLRADPRRGPMVSAGVYHRGAELPVVLRGGMAICRPSSDSCRTSGRSSGRGPTCSTRC